MKQTQTKKLNKNKKVLVSVISIIIVIGIVLAIVLPLVLKNKDTYFKPPKSTLPIQETFALNKYSYDELNENAVTLRSDTHNVTKRNLPRAQTELLSNDFSLVYNTQTKVLEASNSIVNTTDTLKTATITFTDYGSISHYDKNNQVVSSHGVMGDGAFINGSANGTKMTSGKFYKYMLMSQGQHLSAEARIRSANGTLTQDWLKKHPAADGQYGQVLGTNNAVEKEIILDPLYRNPHATGLYLPAGELVTVKVEGLKAGERLLLSYGMQDSLAWVGSVNDNKFIELTGGSITHSCHDNFFAKADLLTAYGEFSDSFLQSQWSRASSQNRYPWLRGYFDLTENKEYKIGSSLGGALFIEPQNCYSNAKITITGAVETPHYILGTTTPEYFDTYLRQAPGVIAVMDTENGIFIGPTGEMGSQHYLRKVKIDEIDKLACLWHSFLSVNESTTGGIYNRFNKIMFDEHVPAGAAVSLGNYSFAHPTGWFEGVTNYRQLLEYGAWGVLHEIGHNHANSYGTFWGFGDGKEGEVHNNALTSLGYIMFLDIGSTIDANGNIAAEHGFVAHPYSSLKRSLYVANTTYTDYSSIDYFDMLSMYTTLMHSFGADKFYELLYTYKLKSDYGETESSNRRSEFAYRCSLVYGMDFRSYFNKLYKANITDVMFSEEQLKYINSLPSYEPIANLYAGGIDGVKTGGDYKVSFGSDITFNLLEKTISSLDTSTEKGVKIVGIDQPTHGKLTSIGSGNYKYSFDKKYSGTNDEFSFYVQTNDKYKVKHKLTVYLRINYNGANVTVYQLENKLNRNDFWNDVNNTISTKDGESISVSKAGVPEYNSQTNDQIRVSEFYWHSPYSGNVEISAIQDDRSKIYFGNTFDNLDEIITYDHDNSSYTNSATINVEKNKIYAFRIVNVNTGGKGLLTLGIRQNDSESFKEISLKDICNPLLSLDNGIPTPYVYEPKYMISKKDNIKLSTTGTDKSDWTVIEAPKDIQGGRTEITNLIDPDTGQPYGTQEIDKWTYLIDGVTGTNLHTRWSGGGLKNITESNPHVFTIDLSKVQPINYISVTTRNNVNSYTTNWEFQVAKTLDGNWKTVASGDKSAYQNQTITKQFSQTDGRYVRILVKGTTGGNFSVLAEIDAGIKSTTQRIISINNQKIFTTSDWKNSNTMDSESNGYLITSKKNQKAVIKFKGTSFALYAATGSNYGSFNVKIDGKLMSNVSLDSEIVESRKLVYYKENLDNKEHTVEIITTDSGKVMLNIFGIPYGASLLNAPNIYLERGLAISLSVFIILFVAVTVFTILLFVLPSFREKVFGSKIAKLMEKKNKQKNDEKFQKEKLEHQKREENKDKKSTTQKQSATTETSKKDKKEELKTYLKNNTIKKENNNKTYPDKKNSKK